MSEKYLLKEMVEDHLKKKGYIGLKGIGAFSGCECLFSSEGGVLSELDCVTGTSGKLELRGLFCVPIKKG
jgi:hypothetical protein